MDEEWDSEAFTPKEVPPVAVGANKWVGEDEEDDVKDNWEDEEAEEEEEKKDDEKKEPVKAVQTKKKMTFEEKIAEKERLKREEYEKRLKDKEETEKILTPEERLAEKLKQQKLQEESDLLVAMETFGVRTVNDPSSIDSMDPSSKEDFEEFQEALSKKINSYNKSTHFPILAEDLIRNICVNLNAAELKKIKTTIENMHKEKLKAETGDKSKKKGAGKGKAKLRVEGDIAIVTNYDDFDYEDFM